MRESDNIYNSLQDKKIHVDMAIADSTCVLRMVDQASGFEWPSAQLVTIEVYDRTQQRVDLLNRFDVLDMHRTLDGIRLRVGDLGRSVSITLMLRLLDGELSIKMSPADIKEGKPDLYKVFVVNVLPGLMRAGSTGELLIPVNTGVICRPEGKPAREDRFLIYGQQNRWELLPTLPVCAVQTPAGGMVAVATSGAAETECRISTDGKGNGSVGLGFYLRGVDVDKVEPQDREIRYVPIPPGKDITVFTAGVLRRHIMHDLKKPTLAQRAKESPEVAYLLGAYIMKLFYGIQVIKPADKNKGTAASSEFILTMMFDEAKTALKSFADAGVDKIYTQNVGWNINGHDGAYPTRFPVEPRLGGERGFRELVAYGHKLGFQMTVHDNYLDGYELSADFDRDVVCRDAYGQLQLRGFWGGKPSYLLWPMLFTERQLEQEMRRIKELGIRGPYYVDAMGSPLYANYHPEHPGTRTDLTRGIDRILKAARALYGSVATETGFLYCSITADLVANPGGDSLMKLAKPEWPITALLDRCVPLWQLTMCGLVVTENQELTWAATQRALLYAQAPRYEWATRSGIHPVLDEPMIKKIKARYDLLIKRFGHLRLLQMTDWTRTGEIETTTFEDGTKVYADFTTGELRVNGERIAQPDCF